MKKVLAAMAIVLGATQAHAVTAPAWVCGLNFSGTEQGIKVLIGSFSFKGQGDLSCVSATGQRADYPVTVTMKAAPLSPQIAFGKMKLNGLAADITLGSQNPEDILGTYYVAQGAAAVVGGVGVITAVHANLPSLALKVSLQFARGFGINLGLNRMDIALDETRN
jgi:hypothetical protein